MEYIFDTKHYLKWCSKWELNKNNFEVLRLFKSRCDFERIFDSIKNGDMPDYDSI